MEYSYGECEKVKKTWVQMFWISHPSFLYLASVLILPSLEIYFFFFFGIWILVSQLGIEPVPSTVEAWVLTTGPIG